MGLELEETRLEPSLKFSAQASSLFVWVQARYFFNNQTFWKQGSTLAFSDLWHFHDLSQPAAIMFHWNGFCQCHWCIPVGTVSELELTLLGLPTVFVTEGLSLLIGLMVFFFLVLFMNSLFSVYPLDGEVILGSDSGSSPDIYWNSTYYLLYPTELLVFPKIYPALSNPSAFVHAHPSILSSPGSLPLNEWIKWINDWERFSWSLTSAVTLLWHVLGVLCPLNIFL